MSEVLIETKNVSKKFSRNLKKSLIYGVKDIITEVFGFQKKNDLRPTEFWAVKDISFQVRRGESLSLIGHNGAGKSTLLKVLNGLIKPDEGEVVIKGKVGALIELGAGFNPILTGRENIYVNGAVLGFTKEEIKAKFDEIIEFAEIGDFIDTPVQNYSSGMKVRLGFAVAAQMEPDVLLIDEVLAVGDVGFKIKCFNRIAELKEKCAIIFVSHSMPQVARICDSAIYMKNGKTSYQGKDMTKAIESYFDSFNVVEAGISEKLENLRIDTYSINGQELKAEINYLNDILIGLEGQNLSSKSIHSVNVIISDKDYKSVASSYVQFENAIYDTFNFVITIPEIQLGLGNYYVTIQFFEVMTNGGRGVALESLKDLFEFKIIESPKVTAAAFQLKNSVEIKS